ncbi:hypothetical protein BDQ17DRAFT_63997 [Cyathus striatus]|nr:hypothetical protein BDQ17DRAFT_63997 [Cyathus striatus]
MPFSRCMHYDEKGSAINDGCRLRSCAFVHPGDANWERAPASRQRVSGKGSDVNRVASASSWGKPPPVPPARSSSWDTSKDSWRSTTDLSRRKSDNGWKATKSRNTTSDNADWGGGKSDNAWGATKSRSTTSDNVDWGSGKSDNAWGASTNRNTTSNKGGLDDDIASTWGTVSHSSSEKSTTGSSWTASAKTVSKDTGDGVPGGRKKRTRSTNQLTRGVLETRITMSIVGQAHRVLIVLKPKDGGTLTLFPHGKKREAPMYGVHLLRIRVRRLGMPLIPTVMDGAPQDPRRETQSGAWKGDNASAKNSGTSQGWNTANNSWETSWINGNADDNGWGSVSNSSAVVKDRAGTYASKRITEDKRPETQLGAWNGDHVAGSASQSIRDTSASTTANLHDSKLLSTASMKSTINTSSGRKRTSKRQSASKHLLRRVRGPKARARLFTSTVKHTLNAVRLQVDLQRAEEEIARWKRARDSKVYWRSTPATRVKLDSIRQTYGKKAADIKERRDHSLKTLLALPDIQKAPKHRNTATSKEHVMSYTAEFSNWVTDLHLHRRISSRARDKPPGDLETRVDEQNTPHPAPDTACAPATTGSQEVASGTDLKTRGTWNWTEIRQAIAALETKIQATSEEVYTKSFTKFPEVEDVQRKVTDLASKAVADVKKRRTAIDDKDQVARIAALKAKASSIGDTVGVQANRAADLLTRIRASEEELKQIKAENESAQNLCKELEERVLDVENLEEEDKGEVKELTDQIQNLHTHKRKSRTAHHLKTDDIVSHVQSLVAIQLEKEVVPILDMFRKQCQSHNQRLEADVSKRLEPILHMTDAILQKAQD